MVLHTSVKPTQIGHFYKTPPRHRGTDELNSINIFFAYLHVSLVWLCGIAAAFALSAFPFRRHLIIDMSLQHLLSLRHAKSKTILLIYIKGIY